MLSRAQRYYGHDVFHHLLTQTGQKQLALLNIVHLEMQRDDPDFDPTH